MYKRILLITIGLTTIGGTALACNEYTKPKVEKVSIHKNTDQEIFKPCKLEVTDSPRIHNKHCKPTVTPTPVVTPKVTPTPSPTPKATPTSVSPKPTVTPAASPSATPAATPATVKVPTVLPSVGADGK
jgi:hypothetical protein